MTMRDDGDTERERAERIADRLHSASIRLLRTVRKEDDAAGVTAPHLSALSVLVFGGPRTLGELAAAEQVKPPSMTRIVRNLEAAGLAERETDAADRRVARVRATERGREILLAGRRRRVASLAERVEGLDDREMETLEAAAALIERMLGR
jgi:DNA-binding MarR family transcriptional regulator